MINSENYQNKGGGDIEEYRLKINKGLEDGSIVPILFGEEIISYLDIHSIGPESGIHTYQSIKGLQKLSLLQLSQLNLNENQNEQLIAECRQKIENAEESFRQLRMIIPDIDERNKQYEESLDMLH